MCGHDVSPLHITYIQHTAIGHREAVLVLTLLHGSGAPAVLLLRVLGGSGKVCRDLNPQYVD